MTQCADQFAGYTCRLPAGHDGHHRGGQPATGARYRTGRHLGRTIYVQQGDDPTREDVLIGMMDTPELGERVVAALNAQDGHRVETPRLPRDECQQAIGQYIDRMLENETWEQSGEEAAARIMTMVDRMPSHLSRDELIHIAAASVRRVCRERFDDRAVAAAVVDVLHAAGALPIGELTAPDRAQTAGGTSG